MARKVLLPREIGQRLDNLTGLVQEVNGILPYRKQGETCPLEAMFISGVGSEGHVQSLPERMHVANEFFRRNPDYQYVKFHTHSRVTIARFGDYYATHFSSIDLKVIEGGLKENMEYMAMLVTSKTKLLSGFDNPQLVIVDDFPGYKEISEAIKQAMGIIAGNFGYDLSNLRATLIE